MPTTSKHLSAPSSSSSPSWDVFLSFYGKDTRRNFISHLYFSLDQAEILTFIDDLELEKGEKISSELLKAIHGSKMFVVVLSENYACSPWCLNELVEILNHKNKHNRVVPVFYYVDPSDLRHQRGSFGEALNYHMKLYSVDIIEKWKSALAEISQLSGYHLRKDADENESNIIQEIVENVLQTCMFLGGNEGKDLQNLEELELSSFGSLVKSKSLMAICDCGEPAMMYTSRTLNNPGRRFFTCSGKKDIRCNYFEWYDPELEGRYRDIITYLNTERIHLEEKIKLLEEKIVFLEEKIDKKKRKGQSFGE